MAQAHGDRLTAVDASFLAQETPTSHMHVGAVTVFEGPAPAYADFAAHIRSRPHLVPPHPPRPPLPPAPRRSAAGDRPPAVGRRPELQPRLPPAPHRAARPGVGGTAARDG